jgi:broad specificity phosphatase PhoE
VASFLLIRHAEAPWSPDEMRPLSPSGRRAAERLPTSLAGFGIEAIYSSPYTRALETAEPLANHLGLPVQELRDLRERTLGSFRCETVDEAVAATWSDFDFAHPGGESSRAAQARARAVTEMLARRHPVGPVALATHGNLLALLLNAFDPSAGVDLWRSLTLPDVFHLRVCPDGGGLFERVLSGSA